MSSTQTTVMGQLRDAYRRVEDRIAEAAQRAERRREDVLMVAVTKTASPDQIRALIDMGQVDFGENRVQHLAQRAAALEEFLSRRRTLGGAASNQSTTTEVRWHMVGHLQRNKVKTVVPLVKLIHSVNSLRLAEELHAYGGRIDRVIDILLQINTTGDPARQGVAAPAVIHLAEQIDTMMYLRLRGIMAMAPHSDNPEKARPTFAQAAEIFNEIQTHKSGGPQFNILSMGMTNDFEIAIEEGGNVVRIGRALFGDTEEN